ncbi:MAG: dephospho-CoA kinase, partial [Cyanobacteria bacterium K_DeepCast_150m_m2_101]|nr:dephospho-CoA kinase [Cyanobacteria bacterium K_DeepCast_150m_m2_101]
LQRLLQRDGLHEAAAAARINAQWPLERKRPLADQVIDNRTDPSQLPARLSRLLKTSALDG